MTARDPRPPAAVDVNSPGVPAAGTRVLVELLAPAGAGLSRRIAGTFVALTVSTFGPATGSYAVVILDTGDGLLARIPWHAVATIVDELILPTHPAT